MPLPYAIENLLTLQQPGSKKPAPLIYAGAAQTIVDAFPPGVTISLSYYPKDDWCIVIYRSALGPAVLPRVFYGVATQWGNRQYEGELGSFWQANEIDSWVITSQQQPSNLQITNISMLGQYYEGLFFFVGIRTEKDWYLIHDALKRQNVSPETDRLLGRMADVLEGKRVRA